MEALPPSPRRPSDRLIHHTRELPVDVFEFLSETGDHLRLALVFVRNLCNLLADDLGPVRDVVDGARDLFRYTRLLVCFGRDLTDPSFSLLDRL